MKRSDRGSACFALACLPFLLAARSVNAESAEVFKGVTPFGVVADMPSYSAYVETQQQANIRKIQSQWVKREDISLLSRWLRMHNVLRHKFGLCHGTRRGLEQQWFLQELGWENGTGVVLGTEISATASHFANTIQWDFHDVRDEWVGSADFVYSNALDHSFNPKLALTQWIKCLGPDGVLLLEHSANNEYLEEFNGDIFAATFSELLALVLSINGIQILDVLHGSHNLFRQRVIVVARTTFSPRTSAT